MKLFNHTKIPDQLLENLLYESAKAVGSIRTAKVAIKVTENLGNCFAHRGFVYASYMKGERRKNGKWRSRRLIDSDGGWLELNLGAWMNKREWIEWIKNEQGEYFLSKTSLDPMEASENVYKLMAHEWRHIRDFQKGEKFGNYNKRHNDRPHERRANNSMEKAVRMIDKRQGCADAILALAIHLEQGKGVTNA